MSRRPWEWRLEVRSSGSSAPPSASATDPSITRSSTIGETLSGSGHAWHAAAGRRLMVGAVHAGSVAWLLVVSIGSSALGGALGMASGIFIVPVLTLFGGLEIHAAVAASIVSVIACSCGSAASFLRSGLTNIRVAIVLEVATTLGALTGVLLAGILSTPFLYFLFAAVLLVSASQMMARRHEVLGETEETNLRDWATLLRLHSCYPDHALGRDVFYRVRRVPLGLALMYGAGLISALLGIGSGVLKIPAMDTALRLPIKVSPPHRTS